MYLFFSHEMEVKMRITKLKISNFRGICGRPNTNGDLSPAEGIAQEDIPLEVDLTKNLIFLIGKNNAGKSSILHAYEKFVVAKQNLEKSDFNNNDTSKPVVMELWLEAETEEELNNPQTGKSFCKETRIGKIRKTWKSDGVPAIRETYDPEVNEWKENGFGGLETIVQNRCPEPKWISGFMAPDQLVNSVKAIVKDALIANLLECDEYKAAAKAVEELQNIIQTSDAKSKIEGQLNKHINQIFPGIKFQIDAPPSNDLTPLLEKNTDVLVTEQGGPQLPMANHGHGVRRQFILSALEGVAELLKEVADRKAQAKAAGKAAKSTAKPAAKRKAGKDVAEEDATIADDDNIKPPTEAEITKKTTMLLFEEPELFLHPHAMRLIQRLIYRLAEDSPYQIMAATHSPILVDLSRPHQTLVRVSCDDGNNTSTRQVSADLFSEDERTRLIMLNRFDPHVCEAFFASKVLLVEGDTEAVIVRSLLERCREQGLNKNDNDLHVVNCGSKNNIPLFQKVLRHFSIPYYVFHDLDDKVDKNGDVNSAWTMNEKIWDEIELANKTGEYARRFVFDKNFESAHGYKHNATKGKMYSAYLEATKWNVIDHAKPVVFYVAQILGNADSNVVFDQNYLEDMARGKSSEATA